MKFPYLDHKHIEAIQTQRMEAISFMAAGISHDIKNLLLVILNYTHTIKRINSNKDIQERLDIIISCCEKINEMLKRLMLIGKSINHLKIESINLNEEIKNTVRSLESKISSGIEIKASLGDIPLIYADATAIGEIITNLILNAIQAMPNAGLIEIRTAFTTVTKEECKDHANAYPGRFVTLSIIDNGPGIPMEILPKIFDFGFSSKNSYGIGLAMVYALVEMHAGWIHVESEVGKGTRFVIFIPV